MFKNPTRVYFLLLLLPLLLILSLAAQAQGGVSSCPAFVEQVLAELQNNCSDLPSNTACYGYQRLEATFRAPQPVGYFTLPADRAPLAVLEAIRSAPLNPSSGDWGVAVLSLQADLPDTLAGQAVTFILMGDGQLQNSVPANSPNPPMQAFYFSSGLGASTCKEAPSVLAIRGPEGITVNLTINGAQFTLGSLVTLFNSAPDQLVITVHEGQVTLEDGTLLTAGQTRAARTDAEGSITGWEDARPATEDERALGPLVSQFLAQVGAGAPAAQGPLYHIVRPGENLFRIARLYDTSVVGIAQANGLSSIGLIYVGQRLLIPNPGSGFVNATQQPPPPPPPAPPGDGQQRNINSGVDCTNFRATSPIGRLPYGPVTFYWDPAPGANQYRINIYADNGSFLQTHITRGAETNITLDTSTFGAISGYAWEVQALINGFVACVTPRVSNVRDAPPNPTPEPTRPPFTASWACTGGTDFIVSYANLPAGDDRVQINFIVQSGAAAGNGSVFAVPPFSQVFVSGGGVVVGGGVVTALPSGTTINLQPAVLSCVIP